MVKKTTISAVSLFINRTNGQRNCWFKFANGESHLQTLSIAQSNLDNELMEEGLSLKLMEGCAVSYDTVAYAAKSAYLSDKDGSVVTGPKAGVYGDKAGVKTFAFIIDYAAAFAKHSGLEYNANAYAKAMVKAAGIVAPAFVPAIKEQEEPVLDNPKSSK